MKDGAPGADGVRISFVKCADKKTKDLVANLTKELFVTPPVEWTQCIKEGQVIPLHKKGPRNNLNNYRGVCLLAMASRILARVLATRLRDWAETLNLLGEI